VFHLCALSGGREAKGHHNIKKKKGGGGEPMTKKKFEAYLNGIEPPEHDHPGGGGRVSWASVNKYGTWLRRNDPIAFEVAYNELGRERSR
jgi:hypothetical protein